MIEREEVINLIKSYFPGADYETIIKLADDVIRDIIPMMHTTIRKAVNDEKSKYIIGKAV